MNKKLLDILVCPVTKGPLVYDRETQELISVAARLAYPIIDDIPALIESDARPLSEEEAERIRKSQTPR
ncbi:Trm112 family protein [uncultured Thiohalocapsa sp.]|uniref:Trm112 family protein n=1 Tax=uncultured Thiohalocapsa sp. TaxID=768990 RepID=UPI0025FED4F3|nr:Trm112 family protein [uncultured Thiohalocapsa sp.]